MMYRIRILILTGTALLAAAHGDWPNFSGPDWNHTSSETGLADAWPSSGPAVLWQKKVHSGYASPAVRDGKVYLIDRVGEESLLRCLDLDSGKELWNCPFSDPGEMKGAKFAGTRGTPTITEDSAYLVTGYGTFVCIDLNERNVKWKHRLLEDYNTALHQFGIAHAPFVYGEIVLIAPYTKEAGVAAYNRISGERLWVSPGLGAHSYVTPRVLTLCGQPMVVAAGSLQKAPRARGRNRPAGEDDAPAATGEDTPGKTAGLSLQDGSILWTYEGWTCQIAIPHPVALSDNRLFLTGGYNAGSAMIRIVQDGDRFQAEELFKTAEAGAQIQLPIQINGHLLIGSNSNNSNDGLTCLTEDGHLVWRTKDIPGAPLFERGPFLLADGKLILLDGKTGILHLARADASGYRELASAQIVKENDMTWAPLALSNGKLLVRDWNTLKCVDLK